MAKDTWHYITFKSKVKVKVKELRMNIIELKNNTKNPPRLSVIHCASDDVHKCIGNMLSTIAIVTIREATVSRDHSEMDREIMIFLNSVHMIILVR